MCSEAETRTAPKRAVPPHGIAMPPGDGRFQTRPFDAGHKRSVERFISLPKAIYKRGVCSQNVGEERALIKGSHPLSGYFETQPFIQTCGEKATGRAMLFFYPSDPDVAYLGFFELVDDREAAAELFGTVETHAAARGCNRMVGPVNASFWTGYRMKMNRFDESPYFGEPYNAPYYPQLWAGQGYRITDHYISNHYRRLTPGSYQIPKYQKRRDRFLSQGYQIETPSTHTWDDLLHDVYTMISTLYASFPAYTPIAEEDFRDCFSGLRFIVDFSLCRLVRHQGSAVAFAITMPDYGTLLNAGVNPKTLLQILAKRRRSTRYVVLYLGVEPQHVGLGPVMVQELIEALEKRNALAIGALIHEGKLTQGYAADYIESANEYALFEKMLMG